MNRPVIHSLVNSLRVVPEFATLDDETLLRIVGASANLFWRAGSTIFEKGSPAEALYIVLSGQARIFDVSDGQQLDVVQVGPCAFFGEHALLLDSIHSKSAQAVEGTELMVVPKRSFQALLADNPDLAADLRSKLEARLAEERQKGQEPLEQP